MLALVGLFDLECVLTCVHLLCVFVVCVRQPGVCGSADVREDGLGRARVRSPASVRSDVRHREEPQPRHRHQLLPRRA
jgi:hypothetical protein